MSIHNEPILVWSYRYAVDTSPTVKGIITFLQHANFEFEVATDYPFDQSNFGHPVEVLRLEGFRPYRLPQFLRRMRGSRWFFKPVVDLLSVINEGFFLAKLRSLMIGRLSACRKIICIEAFALRKLQQMKIPPEKIVYVSLESEQLLRFFNRHYLHKYVEACSKVVVQSEERGKKLSMHYRIHPKYVYVPVGCHPLDAPAPARKHQKGTIRFVYSGYFATWAMVLEIIESFAVLADSGIDAELVLHGHHGGTEAYFSKVREAVEGRSSITVRDDYFSDAEHLAFLSEFDVGIALYKEEASEINWQDLLFSSGKIATYLWAGLPVITNVFFKRASDCPFIIWDPAHADTLIRAYERVKNDGTQLRDYALKAAREDYNLFTTFAPALAEEARE